MDFQVSEKANILRIINDPELGMLTFAEKKRPYKGRFPDAFIGAHVNAGKGFIIFTLFLLARSPLGLFLLVPSFRHKFFLKFAESLNKNMMAVYLQPSDMCYPAKEIYRAIEKVAVVKKPLEKFFMQAFTGSFISIFEFDDAYRFRIQDILSEINKVSLRKSPRKELRRVLDIAMSREGYDDLRGKYRMLKIGTYIAPPKYLKLAVDILLEIDTDKVKLDYNDQDWYKYKCYDFGGFHYPGGRYSQDMNLRLDYNLLYNNYMKVEEAPQELQDRIETFKQKYAKLVEVEQVDVAVEFVFDKKGIVPTIIFTDKKPELMRYETRLARFKEGFGQALKESTLYLAPQMEYGVDGLTPKFNFIDKKVDNGVKYEPTNAN